MLRAAVLLALLSPALGCGSDGGAGDGDAGDVDASIYPAPDDDVVPTIGAPGTLELAAWNIENFPRAEATPKMVADLIASMDLDLVAVEEVENVEAWDELIARLPEHSGVLSSHSYGNGSFQKIGYIYRTDLITLEAGTRLFDDEFAFPRPPLQVIATIDNGTSQHRLVLIALHLKAGREFGDRQRREDALVMLEEHIRTTAQGIDEDVVVLGDFNEVVTSGVGRAVFDPFFASPALYTVETDALAQGGAFTFVPSGSMLDHVVTTASLADERAGGEVIIPPLHTQYSPYNSSVSDHLPVVVTMPIL